MTDTSHPAVTARTEKWVGALPNDWSGARLFQVADAWTSNVDKHSVHGEPSVRLCNYTDVYKNDSITKNIDFMAATATRDQIVRFQIRRGDTIITKDSETTDDIGIPAFVQYEADDLVCGYHLAIVRPRAGVVDPRFLFWAMKSRPTLDQWSVTAAGVTRVGIRSIDLTKVTVPLPPRSKQRRIADFLDQEAAQIDALIAKQDQLIGTLRERRAAVAEVSLTSLAWNVPLRAVASLIQTGPFGSQINSSEYMPGGVPVINPSHIAADGIVPDPNVAVSEQKALQLARHAFFEGDLVVARRGELGRCAVVDREVAGGLCGTGSALIRPQCERILPRFLALVFSSRRTRETLSLQSVGSTMDNLNASIISSLRVPVPKISKQVAILDHTDHQVAKIDGLVAKAQEFIALARERRAALITEAVTGRIDVSTGTAREGA